jgi:hypothetical protein
MDFEVVVTEVESKQLELEREETMQADSTAKISVREA